MRATAIAQPNIALIKYWGKRDAARNLPAVGSISITLSDLYTKMTVQTGAEFRRDSLLINGERNDQLLPRLSGCIDTVMGRQRDFVAIESSCNFPIAAGLASSASSFSAATVAAARVANVPLDTEALARLAGRASGSAARSLYGGFVELANEDENVVLSSLRDAESWPLVVNVAITETGPKAMGSGEAMEISRKTSPFYSTWVKQQSKDLDAARDAIRMRDFARLAAIAEHNCLKMHSVMWASRPPMVYWNSSTLQCLQTIRQLQNDGRGVFFTIDAGPQVKAVCLAEDADAVRRALTETPGVVKVMRSGLGLGARLLDRP